MHDSPVADSNHMKMLSNAKNENKCSAASEHARNVSVKLSFRERNMKINVLAARFSLCPDFAVLVTLILLVGSVAGIPFPLPTHALLQFFKYALPSVGT